jgi:hypothetical protein
MRPIIRAILVPIVVPANAGKAGNRINFPDVPELRRDGTMVHAVECCAENLLSITPDLNPVTAAAFATLVNVTLFEKSDARFQQIPFNLWNPTFLAGLYREVQAFTPDLQRSFVGFTGASVAIVPFTLPFIFHYSRPGDAGR